MLILTLLTALVLLYARLCLVVLATVFDRVRLVGRLAAGRQRRIALARRVRILEDELLELARSSLGSLGTACDEPPTDRPDPDGGEAAPAPPGPRPIMHAVAV